MTRSPWRHSGIATLAFFLVACVGTLAAPPAAAHTDLLSVDPADGAQLDTWPEVLTLTFTEDMSPGLSTITARIGGGETLDLELSNGASPAELVAAVPRSRTSDTSTPGGRTPWRISYRVVSRDGHPVAGSFTFTVRSSAAQLQSAEEDAPTEATPPADTPPPVSASTDPDPSEPAGVSGGFLVVIGAVVIVLVFLAGVATVRLTRRRSEA
ncbi:methionine-rich copper-binding protein CopC [Nocardioides salarius]|uniref:Methionine-rich copper-binding protein CopC n=1 Tax=Nocardioides salarius TaxID=374513 RepID=A0ABS2MEB4_9ACTN|nr:copper resistance CopC family protein [Nocardioides salarius]MBM7509531.1 methionine-rich copper-binding protein CopC [Nocardioides salarius]